MKLKIDSQSKYSSPTEWLTSSWAERGNEQRRNSKIVSKQMQNSAQKNVFPFFSFRLPTDSRMGADNTWWWGAAKNNSHSSSLLCRIIHSALLFFCLLIEGSRVWPSWTHQHRRICRMSSACKHKQNPQPASVSWRFTRAYESILNVKSQPHVISSWYSYSNSINFYFLLVPLIGGSSIQINRKINEFRRCYFIFYHSNLFFSCLLSPHYRNIHTCRLCRFHADADIQQRV